jgi:hypothetical protein
MRFATYLYALEKLLQILVFRLRGEKRYSCKQIKTIDETHKIIPYIIFLPIFYLINHSILCYFRAAITLRFPVGGTATNSLYPYEEKLKTYLIEETNGDGKRMTFVGCNARTFIRCIASSARNAGDPPPMTHFDHLLRFAIRL